MRALSPMHSPSFDRSSGVGFSGGTLALLVSDLCILPVPQPTPLDMAGSLGPATGRFPWRETHATRDVAASCRASVFERRDYWCGLRSHPILRKRDGRRQRDEVSPRVWDRGGDPASHRWFGGHRRVHREHQYSVDARVRSATTRAVRSLAI